MEFNTINKHIIRGRTFYVCSNFHGAQRSRYYRGFRASYTNLCRPFVYFYPYMEYVILALPQDTPHDIEELYAYLKKQSDRLDITLLLEDTVDALFMALSQHTRGTYIQWLIPGATIPDNKFRYIGAALTNNPAPMFICHLTLNIEVKTINAKIVFFSQGKNLLSWLREHHIPDNYALTLPLFRQEDIAKLQYLKPCFHDGSFHADILWNSLLPECEILITI